MWEKARYDLKRIPKNYAALRMQHSLCTLSRLPADLQADVNHVANKLVRLVSRCTSTERKIAMIYRAVTLEISYDYKGVKQKIPYTFVGALCNRRATCLGIAQLIQYFCSRLDIPAITVVGYTSASEADTETNSGMHAWNLVKLSDNRYYHLDATFDLHKPAAEWLCFLKSDYEMLMLRHFWLREDYPKAPRSYPKEIKINQKGADFLCTYWRNLTDTVSDPASPLNV